MKIELIKETENNIDHVIVWYKVYVDKVYVTNTLCNNLEEALKIYDYVVKNNGVYNYKIIETVKQIEI